MDQTIFALLTICSLNSILIIAASIFNISNVITSFKGGPEAHPRVRFSDTEISIRYTLTFGGYLLATALFCTNTVLAFERHWVIRYSRSLSYRAILIIVAIGALFFSFLVSAFVIASANSITGSGFNFHFGRPFAMPGNRSNTRIMVLFMLGMSYFPLSILVIIGVYMNSYRLISTVVDETYDMHRIDCDNESQLDTVNSSSSKAKRRVLVRCALMGLGCLAFYFPTLFCIFWDRLSNMESSGAADTKRAVANNCTQSSSRSVAASPSWMYPTTTVLPALDVLWTPILILWVQAQHRLAFIKLGKDMRRAVFGY
ncbi:hypothetical protein BDR26DRAFT_855869 [Obelidium mucronatum]|nr:hypothetical protein BDR26DRAFT_855869 [Obelidium mucronatum]